MGWRLEKAFKHVLLLRGNLWDPFSRFFDHKLLKKKNFGIWHEGSYLYFNLHMFCVSNEQKSKHDQRNLSYYRDSDTRGPGCGSVRDGVVDLSDNTVHAHTSYRKQVILRVALQVD